MTLSKETLEEIAELARKATYKPCAMHITNLVARCDSEVVEELIRELLERRERDGQEPVAWMHSDNGLGIPAITRSKKVADSWASNGWAIKPLYAAMPAPAVPDVAKSVIDPDDPEHSDGYRNGWNACRAAMLKGGQQ